MGRPLGSQNKAKPSKEKAKVDTTVSPVEKKYQAFRVGRMLGEDWGVYAISKYDSRPVLVYVGKSEAEVNEISDELNSIVSFTKNFNKGTI
jgi:hypothetical protein